MGQPLDAAQQRPDLSTGLEIFKQTSREENNAASWNELRAMLRGSPGGLLQMPDLQKQQKNEYNYNLNNLFKFKKLEGLYAGLNHGKIPQTTTSPVTS